MRKCGVGDANTGDRTMEVLDQQLAHRGRGLREAIDHRADRLVAQARQEVRLPVVERATGIGGIEHRVHRRVGHRPDGIHDRCSELLIGWAARRRQAIRNGTAPLPPALFPTHRGRVVGRQRP